MKRTSKEIISNIKDKSSKDLLYYQLPIIQNIDSDEFCTDNNRSKFDIIAEMFLNDEVVLDYYTPDIKIIRTRFIFDHLGNYGDRKEKDNEKTLCRYWFNCGFPKELEELGEPVDYESNIAGVRLINIDLVSINSNTMFLIEVKGTQDKNDKIWKTPESLLRAVLEIETYYQTLKQNGNLDLFIKTVQAKEKICDNRDNIKEVKKVVVVPKHSGAYQMYLNKDGYYDSLIKLIKKYDITIYPFDETKPDSIDKDNYRFK